MPWRRLLQSVCILFLSLFLFNCSENSSAPVQTFSSPARISAVDSYTLLVSDYTENKFCTVDKATLEIGTCFTTMGQPTGVVYVDYAGGRYFVGNKSVGSVDMFDNQGNFLGHVGGRTNLFGRVNDLALDTVNGYLYVLDSKDAVIKAFDFEGNDLNLDFGAGILQLPTAIAVDLASGFIYISDFGAPDDIEDSSIVIFNSSRQWADSIPGKGGGMMGSLIFSAPQGLFIDAAGNIFFVDSGFAQVFVYDSSLSLVKTVGERGTEVDQLFYPLDLIIDDISKDIFISDNRNGRVTVFRGEGAVP